MTIRNKRKIQHYFSLLLAFIMLVVTTADPRFGFLATAAEPARISGFSFTLESGADNTGGAYVWTPPEDVSGHQFVYRISYMFMGEGFIEPGDITITIPKHILKGRNNYYADLCELPMTEISEATGGNEFAYYTTDNEIVITNIVPLSSTSEGLLDIGYSTTRTTYYYQDMVTTDVPTATMNLYNNGSLVDTSQVTGPAVSVDTSAALIRSTKKASSSRYASWNNNWGPKPADADDYYYVIWSINSEVSATQPFWFELTEDYHEPDSDVVGYKLFGRSTFSNVRQAYYSTISSKDRVDYVLTRHLKSSYTAEQYSQTNAVSVKLTPADEPEKATTIGSTAIFNYDRPQFVIPTEGYNAWKYGTTTWNERFDYDWDVADYELTEFVAGERDSLSGNVKFLIDTIAYPYPKTLLEEASPEDYQQYGKRPIYYTLVDDKLYFNDSITTEMEEITIPEGTVPLTSEDFEIEKIDYRFVCKDAVFNEEEMKFKEVDATYNDGEVLNFEGKIGSNSEWVNIAQIDLHTGTISYDPAYIADMTNTTILFQPNCIAYRITTSNAHFSTAIITYPYYKVKRSENILHLINSSGHRDEMAWLTNTGSYEVKNHEGRVIYSKDIIGRDYFIGYQVNSSLTKKLTTFENNNAEKYATLGWKIDMSESYLSNDGKHYIKQDSGTFYDLLPMGGEADLSTIAIQTENEYMDPSGYDVSTIVNYNNTGRTMLVVKVKDQFEYATLTYNLIYSWESVVDYGSTVFNSIAYETGNDIIASGYPDSGGTIAEGELLSDLDPETDSERFIYAESGYTVSILISASSGLTKTVKAAAESIYTNKTTVRQNGDYTYKLRYSTTGGLTTDDMIIFDSLENFTNDTVQSSWHGILQGVDTSQPQLLGAAPVVYYSSIQNLDINLHRDLGERIEGEKIWKTEAEFGDVQNAKAIAVDLRKNKNGGSFILNESDSIALLLYMKAPPSDHSGTDDPKTYNGMYASYRTTDDLHYIDNVFNAHGYSEVTLRIMADINLRKVSTEDHTTPVKGIAFQLVGASDYGTRVDQTLMTDINGELTFGNIEKGTYTLTEIEGSSEYLPLDAPIVVVIDGDGAVSYNGEPVMEGTYYMVGDVPRYHADISFYKRDSVNPALYLSDIRFELTGTSDYGNEVTLYGQSDAAGLVRFHNLELGTYTLRETNTDGDHILSGNVYTVRVTGNNLYSITVSSTAGEKDDRMIAADLSGTYSIYNEPYHSFTIQKQDEGNAEPIPGAVFELTGETVSGTQLDLIRTTNARGQITFTRMESGVYTLRETRAPYGYGLDPTVRTVMIDKFGTIAISDTTLDSGGRYIVTNRANGIITITKKWLDGLTNSAREASDIDAVIHLTTEKKKESEAYFANAATGGQSLLLGTVVPAIASVQSFQPWPGDDAEALALIENGTAVRLDKKNTDHVIYGWIVSDRNAPDYGTVYWWSDAKNVYLTAESRLFRNLTACKTINTSGIDTSKVVNMDSLFINDAAVTSLDLRSFNTENVTAMPSMFSGCSKLTTVNLSSFNTEQVTNMASMFYNCSSLTSVDLHTFETGAVRDMSNMFYGCSKLPALDLGVFDTSACTTFYRMFCGCSSLANLDVSSFDTSVGINMESMFQGCSSLTELDVSSFDTSSCTNMLQMFYNCQKLASLDLSSFDTSSVNYMHGMFYNNRQLGELILGDSFDTSSCINMNQMFYYCSKLASLDLSKLDTSSVTNMSQMFRYCNALTEMDVSGFDTSSCTNMYYMFANCAALTDIIFSEQFDTSSCTNMEGMFSSCPKLTSLDLSSFNTSSVTTMNYLFASCTALASINFGSHFDTSCVTSMGFMFNNCKALTTLDVSSFDVSSVTDMSSMFSYCTVLESINFGNNFNTSRVNTMASMFRSDVSLTSLDLSSFDTGNVNNMSYIFSDCSNLTSITFGSGFTTSAVYTMSYMFNSCKKLESIDLSGFDTKNVYDMSGVFNSCNALTSLNVSGFDTSSAVYMNNMFSNCTQLTSLDLSHFDTSRVSTMASMFSGCSNLQTLNITGFNTSFVTDMGSMFNNCYALTAVDVSGFNTENVTTMASMFNNCRVLTTIDVSHFNTERVTNMNSMFANCYVVSALDVSGFNTRNVSSMGYMFNSCGALTALNVSGFNTENVTDMNYMFSGLKGVSVLDVSNFDTTMVTSFNYMFNGCNSVTALDVSHFRTPLATSMSCMFNACNMITTLDVTGFDTTTVTNMDSMFRSCINLTELDLSSFDTSAVTNMNNLFNGDVLLHRIYVSDLWDVNQVTSHSNIFSNCLEIEGQVGTHYLANQTNKAYAHVDTEDNNGYLSYRYHESWINDGASFKPCPSSATLLASVLAVGSIKSFSRYNGTDDQAQTIIQSNSAVRVDDATTNYKIYAWNSAGNIYWWSDAPKVYLTGASCAMFYGLTNCTSINLTGIDTSHMTNMAYMFFNCTKLTSLTLGSSFSTASCQSMKMMFKNCSALTTVNISGFDVSNVLTMEEMFSECAALRTVTMGTFHAEKVRSMRSMFYNCRVLQNMNTGEFYAEKVYDMYGIFYNCLVLPSIDLRHFSTGRLVHFGSAFRSCKAATKILFSPDFVTPRVNNMSCTFYECEKVTELDLSSFDASSLTNLLETFYRCLALTNLRFGSNFVTSRVTTMQETFRTCSALKTLDLSMFDTTSCLNMYWMFRDSPKLETITLGPAFTASRCTDMNYMFYNCNSLTSLNTEHLAPDHAVNLSYMFNTCTRLPSLDLSSFVTTHATNMSAMFTSCRALTSLDLSSFDTAQVNNMSDMFNDCAKLAQLTLGSGFKTDKVVNMSKMFRACPFLTSLDLSNFRTQNVLFMQELFSGDTRLEAITFSSGFNTGSVVNMDNMFYNCQKLNNLDLSSFNTEKVTSMATMFYNCRALTNLDVTGFDTSRVTSMAGMFQNCLALPSLDVTHFNTSQVTTMANMFNGCNVLANLDVSGFDTHEVVSMENMFSGCYVLDPIDVSHFNTREVTNMANMFANCRAVKNLDVSNFDTHEVTNMTSMFVNCYALESLDMSNFDTHEVVNMSSMFQGCSSLRTLDLSSFETPEVVFMNNMFSSCTALESLDVSHFDTRNVTTMASMFSSCKALKALDLSSFVTPKVYTMSNMFDTCQLLESVDISHFDTPLVTTMYRMFYNCQSLKELDMSSFVTPMLTTTQQMFYNCYALETLDMSNFDTTSVTSMDSMFYNCQSLKALDLSNFHTPKLTAMTNMFYNCYELESLDITNFDTSNVTNLSNLFYECRKLPTVDLRSFNTYNVTTMASMFYNCYALTDVDLSNFYTANTKNINYLFYGCTSLPSVDLSSFSTEALTSCSNTFYGCSNLETIYVSNNWDISSFNNSTSYRMFWNCPKLTGQNGTKVPANADVNTNYTRAVIDTPETPGYLTYKAPAVNNATDLVSTNPDECQIEKVTDNVWTYQFSGLNPNVHYYAWEEEVGDYIESNLFENPLEVEHLSGTITNRLESYPDDDPEYGNLTIRKVLTAEPGATLTDADYERLFVFTVTLTDRENQPLSGTSLYGSVPFIDGVATIRITGGTTATLNYIPSGYHYTVTEEDIPTFTQSSRYADGVIETDQTARTIFTNKKSVIPEKFASVTLKKQVTGIFELDSDYLFTVSLSGLHPQEIYTLSDGTTFTTNVRGNATIDLSLNNGGEITLQNLPVGASYKITETAGDYVSSYSITDAAEAGTILLPNGANTSKNRSLSTTTEFVEEDEEISVTFTNIKDARQNVVLRKVLVNAAETNFDVFTFLALITNLAPGETIRTGLGLRTADDDGIIRMEFEMSDNDEITFYKLPVGASYQFTEAENEWVASYQLLSSGSNVSMVSESGENEVNFRTLSTATETVNENEEITVLFSNTKVQRDLTLTKVVDMSGGDLPYAEYSVQPFKFQLELTGLDAGQEYELQYSRRNYAGIERTDSFTPTPDGKASLDITLTHNQSLKLKDLPVGATYTITEAPVINYVSGYTLSGNEGSVILRESEQNRKTCRILSTATETVDETELDIQAVFTNRYYDDPTARICMVTLEKEIDRKLAAFGTPTFLFRLTNTDTGDVFTCAIPLEGDALSGSETVMVTKGHYKVEEITVGRYTPSSAHFLPGTTASETRINNEAVAVEERKAGGNVFSFNLEVINGEAATAYLHFDNSLTNYSGVSHNDFARNTVA